MGDYFKTLCTVVFIFIINFATNANPSEQNLLNKEDSVARKLEDFSVLYGKLRYFYPKKITSTAWDNLLLQCINDIILQQPNTDLGVFCHFERLGIKAKEKQSSVLTPFFKKAWIHKGCGICGNDHLGSRFVKFLFSIWGPYKSQLKKADCEYEISSKFDGKIWSFYDAPSTKNPKLNVSKIPSEIYAIKVNSVCNVIIAWNAIKYFYPYSEYVSLTMDSLLRTSLKDALDDSTQYESYLTLCRLMASINDGHARVVGKGFKYWYRPNAQIVYIEQKLLLKQDISRGDGSIIPRGSELLLINNENAYDVFNQYISLTSSSTLRYKNSIASFRVLDGTKGSKCKLSFKTPNLDILEITMHRDSMFYDDPSANILDQGYRYVDSILIVDLSIIEESKLIQLLKSNKFDGVVLDMREDVNVSSLFLAYLAKDTVKLLSTIVNRISYCDSNLKNDSSAIILLPRKPNVKKPVIFISNESAISASESYLSAIKLHKLGIIVGDTSAGTNGNIVQVKLFGGYSVTFTGMKVVNDDGSNFHGVGVAPDILVRPSIYGLVMKEDELMLKSINTIKSSVK